MIIKLFQKNVVDCGRFIFKFQPEEGRPFSEILRAKSEIDQHIETNAPQIQSKIATAQEKKKQLMESFKGAGLRVRDIYADEEKYIDDLFDADDAGKLIETNFKVEVSSTEEVQKAVSLCKEKRLLAMSIGARTSALGVFEAIDIAKRNGLDGVVGIQMQDITYNDFDSSSPVKESTSWLQIPEYDENQYDLIRHPSCPIAILKSKDFPENGSNPHRIITGAGLHLEDANVFLSQVIKSDKYKFRLMPDPTSKKEAQVGGVVATGAEGGNRSKAEEDILSCVIVNGDAQTASLTGEKARNIVGLNGNAGIVTQVEFEVTAYPKHDHGIFIPIKGKGAEALKNSLGIQRKLKKYCQSSSGNNRIQNGQGPNGIVITSMEPLSPSAIAMATEKKRGAWSNHLNKIVGNDKNAPNCEIGLYVTFSSFKEIDDFDIFADAFYQEIGLNVEGETNSDNTWRINGKEEYDRMHVFADSKELEAMDEIRHGAPQFSREKAKHLGGVTESTDLNIRFLSEDETETQQAIDEVSKIYNEYIESFKAEDGFRVAFYGHMHPGVGQGGGINPHIRIIFELSNPGSRYNAPEQVNAMKKKQTTLYQKLMALDGKYGIKILSPEKSRFTNTSYWNWYSLYHTPEARKYLETILEHGYSRNASGEPEYPVVGARVPHGLPGIFPRVPGGIKGLLNADLIDESCTQGDAVGALDPLVQKYWPAILEMCQLSHRGADIKRIVGDVCALIHEKFHLSNEQYPFFIESPDEAPSIVKRNFGEKASKYKVQNVQVESLEEAGRLALTEENTFYVINVIGLGVPQGLCLMIAPHNAIKDAYEGNLDGTNKAAFRNLYSMWERWPLETDETPNLPAILSLGLVLDRENLEQQVAVSRENKIVTANPGPAQINEAVMASANRLLKSLESVSPARQKAIIKELKAFLGVPSTHSIAFYTSATQIMQALADALAKKKDSVNVVQITNDAFSERLNSILKSSGNKVTQITTPWTSSEHSELEVVTDKIEASIRAQAGKKTVLFVTPHKTSTSADFHPDHLIKSLEARDIIMGRDYDMICDVTSGAGARDYATRTHTDTGKLRIGFTGMFGSMQKAMGQAPGVSFVTLSPQLTELLGNGEQAQEEFSLGRRLKDSESGQTINPTALAMVGEKLESDKANQHTPKHIQEETRKKAHLVLGWAQRHPDLMPLVQNGLDQSPLLIGLFSQAKNLVVAKRLLSEIFGYYIGEGYGPFAKESIRLYLPNIAYDELKNLLAALEAVLSLDDVVKTRGDKIPNIALREPHNPFEVISRLAGNFKVDDIFVEKGALAWVDRLITTYNANVGKEKRKMSDGRYPRTTQGFSEKAKIYGFPDNLEEMAKILEAEDDQGYTIVQHYSAYKAIEKRILRILQTAPEAVYESKQTESEVSKTMRFYVNSAQQHLTAMSVLMKKYIDGNNGHSARKDNEGRVAWPIVA